MLRPKELKVLLRSRSLDYVINSRPGAHSNSLCEYRWKGHTIYYRAGKAEAGLIYDALIRPKVILRPNRWFLKKRVNEYWVPQEINPKTILDIGGNIGVASIYYSSLFPRASIYSFEPVATNYELLVKNTEKIPNVHTFNLALGSENKKTHIFMCEDTDNTGGYSLYNLEVDKTRKVAIELRNAGEFLSEAGVSGADLIKIDTEGAEYDILMSMDHEFLADVKWIIGELHGHKDFELLAYLSKWFDVGLNKSVRSRLFNFYARNKKYTNQIPWKW